MHHAYVRFKWQCEKYINEIKFQLNNFWSGPFPYSTNRKCDNIVTTHQANPSFWPYFLYFVGLILFLTFMKLQTCHKKNHHKRNHIWHEKTPFLHFFGTHRIQYIWRIVLSLYFLDSKSFSWKIHKLIYQFSPNKQQML